MGTRDCVIRKFDKDFDYIAGRSYGYLYDDEGVDIIEDDEGKLLAVAKSKPVLNCAGSLMVLRLDEDLDTLYTRYYGTGLGTALFALKIKRKGDMFYAPGWGNFMTTLGTTDGHLIKTDHNFNLSCGHYGQETYIEELDPFVPATFTDSYNSIAITLAPFSYEDSVSIIADLVCSGSGPVPVVSEIDFSSMHVYPRSCP